MTYISSVFSFLSFFFLDGMVYYYRVSINIPKRVFWGEIRSKEIICVHFILVKLVWE